MVCYMVQTVESTVKDLHMIRILQQYSHTADEAVL